MRKYIPILEWFPHYKREHLKEDISSGIVVGIMLVPQGMAYAAIAGLPLVYGLYASMIPQIIYAFLGTSRQLAVGPVAMDSLLVATGVSLLAYKGTEEYILLVILLTLMSGIIQLLLGLFRLGFLINFLSRPVMSGFTTSVALIIGFSQIKHLIGIELDQDGKFYQLVYDLILKIEDTHVLTFGVGLCGIFLIRSIKYFNKKYNQKIPAALFAVILGILAVYKLNLDEQGVVIIREIPTGLPAFTVPVITMDKVLKLFPISVTIALVAFMEAMTISKTIQAKHQDYEVDSNQELIALGLSNITGSFFQSYCSTGGFSRTAVKDQAGAKTGISSLVSALFIGVTLLFLTPIFYFLPKAILAAIIIISVFNLIDLKYPTFLWRSKRDEFWIFIITLIATLLIGVREGVLVGVSLSLVAVIYQSTKPHVARLGRFENTQEYRNIYRFENVQERKDVLILRYDAQLYFANANHFQDTIREAVKCKGKSLKLLIINAESIHSIDSTGVLVLEEVMQELHQNDIELYFTGVIGPVRDTLYKTGLMHKIKTKHFFLDISYALNYYDHQDNSTLTHEYATQNSYTNQRKRK